MRIEHTGTIINISENSRGRELIQGDVLVAEVTGIDGDMVILKSRDGMALTAKLISDINVSVGDYVETVIDQAGRGRYVLRIVDITRNLANNNADTKDIPAAHMFSNARALRDTLNIMKMNPGTDPKVAAFLSRHDISGAPESIKVITKLTKDAEPVGRLLAEANDLIKQEGAHNNSKQIIDSIDKPMQNADLYQPPETDEVQNINRSLKTVSDAETEKTNNISKNPQSADLKHVHSSDKSNAMTQSDKSADKPNAAYHANQAAGLKTNNKQSAQPEKALAFAEHNEANPVYSNSTAASKTEPKATEHIYTAKVVPEKTGTDSLQKETDETIRQMATDLKLNSGLKAADTNASVVFKEVNEYEVQSAQILSEKITSLFVKLFDKDKLAENIKKAVTELPEYIKELKLSLLRHDTNNKEVLLRKLEPVEKQLALISQIKHFDCFHIPLMRADGSDTTAELYVYRNKKRKAEDAEDDESFVILIGLDTQNLGRIETLIKASDSKLSVILHMEDTRLAGVINDEIKIFKDTAERFGYPIVNVSIEKLASHTTIINAEERLTMQPGTGFGVDIRI